MIFLSFSTLICMPSLLFQSIFELGRCILRTAMYTVILPNGSIHVLKTKENVNYVIRKRCKAPSRLHQMFCTHTHTHIHIHTHSLTHTLTHSHAHSLASLKSRRVPQKRGTGPRRCTNTHAHQHLEWGANKPTHAPTKPRKELTYLLVHI